MNWSVKLLEMRDVPILLDWYNNEELHNIANAKKFKPYTMEQLTDYWREKLSRSNFNYYVILIDEQIVGRVGLKKKKTEEEFEVEYSILISVPILYSKGLGTKRTKHFVREVFLESNIVSIYLGVRADNRRAIRCYEKVNFQITKDFYENNVKIYEMRIDKDKFIKLMGVLIEEGLTLFLLNLY